MTVVPILNAPFSILFLQPLHAARLLLAYSTAGVVCQRENGFEVVCSVLTHWSEQAGFEVVYRGTTRCSFDKKSVFFVFFVNLQQGSESADTIADSNLTWYNSRLAAASTVVIARPPSSCCARLITLLACPTGGGVVARLAPLLSQLQRGHELVLSQLA